jgi:hypothetical protein
MSFNAHKRVVVIFVLLALAAQAYASVFAANMHRSAPVSHFQQQLMAESHITLNNRACAHASDFDCTFAAENFNKTSADSCCEDHSDCSPSHCSSFTGCVVFSFWPDYQIVTCSYFTGHALILSQRIGSLYRPPISRLS